MPTLRFPGFTDEWQKTAIGNILKIGSGRDYKGLNQGDVPVFGTGGYMTSVDSFLMDGETVFIGRKGTINKPEYFNGKFWTVDTLFYTHSFSEILPKFTYSLFQTIDWLKYNEASGVPSLSKSTIEKIEVSIPSLEEQKVISSLLSLIDERIATQNKIIERLESLIGGIMETLYSGYDYMPLGDLIKPVSVKNKNGKDLPVLSVSNKSGFIAQTEQFEGRIIASEDTTNYKVVVKDDFAFNPARINIGSIARLKSYESGIISPMYVCFRVSDTILPEYVEYFLKTKRFADEVEKRLEGSVRRCLTFDALCEIEIPFLDIDSQMATTEHIALLYTKLEIERSFVANLKKQKDYLLASMFI